MLILVLALMQQSEDAVKPRDFLELSFSSGFQIAEQVMFSVTRAVNLIIFTVGIFT